VAPTFCRIRIRSSGLGKHNGAAASWPKTLHTANPTRLGQLNGLSRGIVAERNHRSRSEIKLNVSKQVEPTNQVSNCICVRTCVQGGGGRWACAAGGVAVCFMRQTGTHHFGGSMAAKYEEAKSAALQSARKEQVRVQQDVKCNFFGTTLEHKSLDKKHTPQRTHKTPNLSANKMPGKCTRAKLECQTKKPSNPYEFRISSPWRTLHSWRSFAAR